MLCVESFQAPSARPRVIAILGFLITVRRIDPTLDPTILSSCVAR